MTKSGAKRLAIAVIKQALIDKDLSFIYSYRSDMYFDLAEVQRWRVMENRDDDCRLKNKKKKNPLILPENYKDMRIKDIAELLGITANALSLRLNRGMTIEEAVAMSSKNA